MKQLETRHVQVERVNGHGFQLADGEWLNISKFAPPADVPMPTAGQTVRVALDAKGFVRKVEAVAPLASEPPAAPAAALGGFAERETIITRLAVLNTATALLSAAGRAPSLADVLTCAAQLEAWATR